MAQGDDSNFLKAPEVPPPGEPVAAPAPTESVAPMTATLRPPEGPFRLHKAEIAGRDMFMTVESDNVSWLMRPDAKTFAFNLRSQYPGFADAGIEFHGGPSTATVHGENGEVRIVGRRTFKLTQGF